MSSINIVSKWDEYDNVDDKVSKYYGKKIIGASFSGEELRITFDDAVTISISDNGQSCCEERYMVCNDNVRSIIGNFLTKIEVKSLDKGGYDEDKRGDYQVHEICFLDIQTDKSLISINTHNIHNGYYSGFDINIEELSKDVY